MKASSVEASAAKGWYDDLGNTNEWRSATHPSSPGLAGRAERGKRADLGEHKRGPPSATPDKKQLKQPQPNSMFGRDRKSLLTGKSVSVRVDLGGRRLIKKNKNKDNT